ncbi:MAG: uncharacterized protein A8A55_2243 [Amphiamblys sp. WSBS2006]|nr:MAG: uncharacterized protein A8A55_2243 [Amphiamblys sp. WSBS2006]
MAVREKWDSDRKTLFDWRNYETAGSITPIPTNVSATGTEELETFTALFSHAHSNFLSEAFGRYLGNTCKTLSLSVDEKAGCVVEECLVRFLHVGGQEWVLPGVRPTNREISVLLSYSCQYGQQGIHHLRIHWNQLSVVFQAGILESIHCLKYSAFCVELDSLPSVHSDRDTAKRLCAPKPSRENKETMEGIRASREAWKEHRAERSEFESQIAFGPEEPLHGASIDTLGQGVFRSEPAPMPGRHSTNKEWKTNFSLNEENSINEMQEKGKQKEKTSSLFEPLQETPQYTMRPTKNHNFSSVSFEETNDLPQYTMRPTVNHNASSLSFVPEELPQRASRRESLRNASSFSFAEEKETHWYSLKPSKNNNFSSISFDAIELKDCSGEKKPSLGEPQMQHIARTNTGNRSNESHNI